MFFSQDKIAKIIKDKDFDPNRAHSHNNMNINVGIQFNGKQYCLKYIFVEIIKLKYYFITIYSELLCKVHLLWRWTLESKSEYIVIKKYLNFIIFHKNVLASNNIVYHNNMSIYMLEACGQISLYPVQYD